MYVTFNLSETGVQQLKLIPDVDNFLNQLLEKELPPQPVIEEGSSKWALLAKEIAEKNYFGGYSELLKKDMQEFRENFSFPSDE